MPLWSPLAVLAGLALVAGSARITNAMRVYRDAEHERGYHARLGPYALPAFRGTVILAGALLMAMGFAGL